MALDRNRRRRRQSAAFACPELDLIDIHALSGVEGPIVVATDWGIRAVIPLGALLAACGVAAIFYWRSLQRRQPYGLGTIAFLSAVAIGVAWLAPILFSSDVYAYAAYGEMARIGLDPYLRAPADTSDLLVRAAQAQWISAFPICVYGPGFVALARAVVGVFAPCGVLAQLDAFRVLASAAFLLCTPLAYLSYGGDANDRLRAATTIGLNPVAIWCAAEGHNDALALAIVFAGFVVARRYHAQLGAALIALSGLVKPPGVLAAVAFAVVNSRARLATAAAVAVVTIFSLPLIRGAATQLEPQGHYAPQASLQAIVAPFGALPAAAIAAATAALIAMVGVARLRRGAGEGWIWLALALWTLVPNPYPWYGVWLLAVAALAPRTRAAFVAILLSLTSLLRYAPDAIGTPSTPVAALLGVAASLPLVGLFLV